jgi:hypothetical protein
MLLNYYPPQERRGRGEFYNTVLRMTLPLELVVLEVRESVKQSRRGDVRAPAVQNREVPCQR